MKCLGICCCIYRDKFHVLDMIHIALIMLLILLVMAIAANNLLREDLPHWYGDLGSGRDFSLPQLFIGQRLNRKQKTTTIK